MTTARILTAVGAGVGVGALAFVAAAWLWLLFSGDRPTLIDIGGS